MLLKADINCNIGCLRQNNEDMILLGGGLFRDRAQKQTVELSGKARFAAVVADGMGGHNGGEVASEMALRRFNDFVERLPAAVEAEMLVQLLKQWARDMHHCLMERSRMEAGLEGMGTTFCGLLWYERCVLSIHAGDSRLYRFRSGVLKQLSLDHSMRERHGAGHPSNEIYNALGAGEDAFADVEELTGRLLEDDYLLLCSDGLSDMLPDERIGALMAAGPSAGRLVEAARQAGGKDNISVILIRIINTTTDYE